jgi:DNA-repair protein XRCC1
MLNLCPFHLFGLTQIFEFCAISVFVLCILCHLDFTADCVCLVNFNQDIGQGTEDWKFLPRVVEELAKLDAVGNHKASISKEDIHKQALECKRIYEDELDRLDHESTKNSKINEEQNSKKGRTNAASSSSAVDYDSDDTIEMTEQEIDLAYKSLSSKMRHL